MTSPYDSEYVVPETLPASNAAKYEYENQQTRFHRYEQINPIADGYLRPIGRQSVEEATGYESTSRGYIDDNGYLEINFENEAHKCPAS